MPGKKDTKRLGAFSDYLSGMAIKEIAKKYGVTKRCVEGWRTRERWNDKRKAALAEMQASAYSEYRTRLKSATANWLECSDVVSGHVLALVKATGEKLAASESEKTIINCVKMLDKLAVVAKNWSTVQKNALPQASEELSKAICEELRRIGRAGLMD